ncbi:MAG: WecB/TagA/CpsF family glycosyltransferase [Planctomycetota bacterium]|nr:MAG: WecB/TagA/CpsF family glycosyltransferase [Planctomycetota bacterium]
MDNPDFYKILATSDLLYADGMSVVWAGRWLGYRIPERLTAADYFETFCRRCDRWYCSVPVLRCRESPSRWGLLSQARRCRAGLIRLAWRLSECQQWP